MAILYGVIGTNWITTSWINAANKTRKWQLHAVYSRTSEQAQAFGSKHNCTSSLYTSLEEFAKDPQMQAVYVASPNGLHYSQTKLLLSHGKHVILEKPATSTVRELEDLFALAREKKLFLIEAYRHIQEGNFKVLRDLIKPSLSLSKTDNNNSKSNNTQLGRIYGASFQYATYSSRYTNLLGEDSATATPPNIFNSAFGGGALVDVGVYPVTFALALFGAPKSQSYVPFPTPGTGGVDGGGVILLRYPDFGVQINVSKGYASSQPCEIYGENGTLTLNFVTDIKKLTLVDPRSKESKEFAGPCKVVDQKPDVNMEEEAEEFARILEKEDWSAAEELEELSLKVVAVTMDLRRQNGILYPADKEEM